MRGRVFDNPLLLDLSAKYHKSVAQLLVRWCVQYGVLPLPKTQNPGRMKDNADVFDFEILPEDIERMKELEILGRTGKDPDTAPF